MVLIFCLFFSKKISDFPKPAFAKAFKNNRLEFLACSFLLLNFYRIKYDHSQKHED